MTLRIENNRGFWEKKYVYFDEKIEIYHKLNPKFKLLAQILSEENQKLKNIEIINNTFIIPYTGIEHQIKIEILCFLEDKLIKEIPCDTLIVCEKNNEIVLVPEIEELKSIIEDYKAKFEELSRKVDLLIKLEGATYKTDLGGLL